VYAGGAARHLRNHGLAWYPMIGCWVKENQLDDRPCDGRLRMVHLIPKQRIKKRFPTGAVDVGTGWEAQRGAMLPVPVSKDVTFYYLPLRDPATWRWVCGGPMGQGGHHGRIDGRQIKVPRSVIPLETEEWAERFGLAWSLDHDYGART
jgi:hypothetical protein